MNKEKIALILNASSGNHEVESLLQQIKEISGELSIDLTFFLVHLGSDIRQIIQKALNENYNIIVAAGGDGTVSAVARELAGTTVVMGVIPLGTFNHFAKDIQIPLDLKEAITVLSQGNVKAFDLASVNNQYFINNSSIGLYTKILKFRESFQQKGFNKWLAMLLSFFSIMSKKSFQHLHIMSTKKDVECNTPILFIGNNRYAIQGYELGSRTSLDRGKLFFALMHRTTYLRFFWDFVRAVFGLEAKTANFDVWESQDAVVKSDKKFLQIALDGEIVSLKTPLYYLIHPRSLRVIVP